MQKIYGTAIILALLSGCGGSQDAPTDAAASPAPQAQAAAPAVKINNPLAAQQQAIRDAEAVQEILRENAEAKKSAIRQMN
jgi:hypothetical protein